MPFNIYGQRRAVPPTPPDPGTLGAIQWLRSDSRVDVAGQCQTLVDLTTFGRDMEATASGLQPSPRPDVVPAVLDGHPALRMANDKRMVCAAFNVPIGTGLGGGLEFTWGIIASNTAASVQQTLFDSGDSLVSADGLRVNRTLSEEIAHSIFDSGAAEFQVLSVQSTTAILFSLAAFDEATDGQLYIDAVQVDTETGALGTARTLATATMFCQGNTGGAWGGDWFEWFLFDRKLAGTDLTDLFAYVATRYPSL